MSSKKSSQAQPRQLPPTAHPDHVHCGSAAAPLAAAAQAQTAPPREQTARFACPVWPPQLPEVAAELTSLLASGAWGHYQGQTLQRLRDQMAQHLGVAHVRLVCSGSAAIELALRACGVGAGGGLAAGAVAIDGCSEGAPEVICPVLDYPGNVRAVRLLGAIPVLVDTVPGGWTLDPEAVLAAATPRTVAVIASHLYGEIAAVAALREICDRRGWSLIEDVCQMPGGDLGGRPLGSFGHAAAWSFGGSKPLTAGCGGAITTDDDRIAQRLAAHADRPSDAFALSPLQAAVLIPQWAALAEFGRRQRARLKRLVETCRPQTPHWQWPLAAASEHQAVFYKVPLVARGAAPGQIVQAAADRGVPVGEPFRVPQRIARSRGRIESAAHARAIVAKSWLIDHRVLAGDEGSVDDLAQVLIDLHNSLAAGEA